MKAYAFHLTDGQYAYLPVEESDGNNITISSVALPIWFEDGTVNPPKSTVGWIANQLPDGVDLSGIVEICHIEGP